MSKRYCYKKILGFLASGAFASMCSSVGAAGFQIQEQNVTNLGTAYAGTASLAEDASTGFYNPAGLTRLGQEQVAFSAVAIIPHTELTATRATPTFNPAINLAPGTARVKGEAVVPGFHYMYRFNGNWVGGINVVMPFGLKTKYKENELARYIATHSELRTIDITPTIAYDFCNGFSIGAGPDFVHGYAELETRFAPVAAVASPATDGFTQANLSDWAVGGHAGVMYAFNNDCTRIGLVYHSELKFKGRGEHLVGQPAVSSAVTRQGVRGDLRLPSWVVLSVHHQFNEQWAVMADAAWTNWKKFREVRLHLDSGVQLVEEFRFRDSQRYALGFSYQHDSCWKFRIGGAYERSPVTDENRTARIPDSDRYWAAIGVQYRFSKCLALEFGYAHLFFKNGELRQSALNSGVRRFLDGRYKSRADLLGVQVTWDLA